MKLHFEPNLDYQLQAIEAVCALFRGQEICRTEFTVTMQTEKFAMQGYEEPSQLGMGTNPDHQLLETSEHNLLIYK